MTSLAASCILSPRRRNFRLKSQIFKQLHLSLAFALGLLSVAGTTYGQLHRGIDSTSLLLAIPNYAQPINPDLFLIRPGEELTVTFLKTNLPSLMLRVSPEGRVVNSGIGVFDLSNKTLSEARKILYDPLNRQFNAKDLEISVGRPLKVNVLVTGEVKTPGTYSAYSSDRVSSVIRLAGGIKPTGSSRFITLQGGVHPIDVDLDVASYQGKDSADPYLYAGSWIDVPHKHSECVQVTGEVESPREIELKPTDNLSSLLALAGGLDVTADSTSVHILGHSAGDAAIKSSDIIVVPSSAESSSTRRVSIFGEIAVPGRYDFRDGVTLEQLLQQAGGVTPACNTGRITIFRRTEPDEWGKETAERYPISAALAGANALNATLLRPGDSVLVPRLLGYIRVSGLVRNPGLQPYVSGKDALYFITGAGGFLPLANMKEIELHDRVSGLSHLGSPSESVQDGDEIVVRQVERTP